MKMTLRNNGVNYCCFSNQSLIFVSGMNVLYRPCRSTIACNCILQLYILWNFLYMSCMCECTVLYE